MNNKLHLRESPICTQAYIEAIYSNIILKGIFTYKNRFDGF